jgi:hypothetical protein
MMQAWVVMIGTERLGWPRPAKGWRQFVPWESQSQLVYDDRPEEPTACCHLQPAEESPALCGFPWECLVTVPGERSWESLEDWMRCDECVKASGS